MQDNEWLQSETSIQPSLELINKLWKLWEKLGMVVSQLITPGKLTIQDV
jgi:hypothetical protein